MRTRAGDLLVEASEAVRIIGHSAWCIEVDGLERPHERPAPAQAVAYGSIDVLATGDTVFHQCPRFAQQGSLQSIQYKSLHLFTYHHNAAFQPPHEICNEVDGGARGSWRWN